MKVFSVELKLLGEMSQLPDSQKVFGALMYFLLHNGCESKYVNELVRSVRNREIYFALSNVMPKGYLPTPKLFIEHRAVGEAIFNDKSVYFALKKRDFATQARIKCYQNNLKDTLLSDKNDIYISLEINQQIHINTEGIDQISSDPKNLIFSIQRTICKYSGSGSGVKDYQFYIRCEDNCKIITLLQDNLNYIFTLGKRSSQGYNLFELVKVELDDEIEKTYANGKNTYLNLGMLLPDKINFINKNSFLELFSSERRTFSSDKWDDSSNRGHFISFIAPGSMIVTDYVEEAGKCVSSPNERGKNGEIVFGNAFLLPWEVCR